MRIELECAREADAAAVTALRHSSARQLTQRYGHGAWSAAHSSVGGVEMEARTGELFLARIEGTVVVTLRLSAQNPWLGDTGFFTANRRPLFLTSMAVHPSVQRQGVGRGAIHAVVRLATQRRADALRLDAFDAPAGAGGFYRKCGFHEVHRARYFDTPLIWFERLL